MIGAWELKDDVIYGKMTNAKGPKDLVDSFRQSLKESDPADPARIEELDESHLVLRGYDSKAEEWAKQTMT
ncbi:MAG: hypothetical protein ACE5IR_22785 [bacterium]